MVDAALGREPGASGTHNSILHKTLSLSRIPSSAQSLKALYRGHTDPEHVNGGSVTMGITFLAL